MQESRTEENLNVIGPVTRAEQRDLTKKSRREGGKASGLRPAGTGAERESARLRAMAQLDPRNGACHLHHAHLQVIHAPSHRIGFHSYCREGRGQAVGLARKLDPTRVW